MINLIISDRIVHNLNLSASSSQKPSLPPNTPDDHLLCPVQLLSAAILLYPRLRRVCQRQQLRFGIGQIFAQLVICRVQLFAQCADLTLRRFQVAANGRVS